MASLFVIRGRDQGRRFDIDSPVLTVGRESSNSIQLADTEVSRRHAEIRQDDGFALVDLDSSNGTFVNGERIERCELRSGDRLQFGRTLLIFTATEEGASDSAASAIDIVGREDDSSIGGSRIVSSAGQQGAGAIVEEGSESWLARARSNLQVMYHTALAVSHTLDIEQLLERIMELIFEWVEADRGCIMLIDRTTGELRPKARRNRSGVKTDEKITISQTILDYVLQNREGVLTTDARQDERFDAAGSIVKLGVREAICAPMQGRYDNVGVIYIDTYTPPGRIVQRAQQRFTEEHLKLMVAIAHQAALAVEDTSYYSAMVQAERLAAMGQTIATLSHHIKNILQGIRGGSYLIEEGLKAQDFEVVRKGWSFVERHQERISNLVLDMLTYSKERTPELIPANLNDVVGDVIELMQTRAQHSKVELVWRPDETMPRLTFDPEAMHRAVLNVVTNAIDACAESESPRVDVFTLYDSETPEARVYVRDNGPGVPPAEQKKIFTVFASDKGARGTGLGLPVSQKIIQEHGGEIDLESEVGGGATFCLRMPAQPASEDEGEDGGFKTVSF